MNAPVRLPDLGRIVRATATATDGGLSMMESVGQAPGEGPPLHIHTREDEACYVIEGSYIWQRGDEHVDAVSGSFIWLPRGIPHWFIVGPSGGRMLHLYLPGGIDGYFVEWQEAIAAGAGDEEWRALAARSGLSYANEQR